MKRYAFTNRSGRIQVIKTRIRGWERTLFPGQQAMFEADPEDFLEVYTYQSSTAILEDRMPCLYLHNSWGYESSEDLYLLSAEPTTRRLDHPLHRSSPLISEQKVPR